jgi:hypothetical protein
MNSPAFQLVPPPSDQREQDFLEAWKEGIKASGHHTYFGGDTQHLERAQRKEQLAPYIKNIKAKIMEWPMSQAALVVAMVGFYNPAEGKALQDKLNLKTPADLSLALKPHQREIVARLIVNYERW